MRLCSHQNSCPPSGLPRDLSTYVDLTSASRTKQLDACTWPECPSTPNLSRIIEGNHISLRVAERNHTLSTFSLTVRNTPGSNQSGCCAFSERCSCWIACVLSAPARCSRSQSHGAWCVLATGHRCVWPVKHTTPPVKTPQKEILAAPGSRSNRKPISQTHTKV